MYAYSLERQSSWHIFQNWTKAKLNKKAKYFFTTTAGQFCKVVIELNRIFVCFLCRTFGVVVFFDLDFLFEPCFDQVYKFSYHIVEVILSGSFKLETLKWFRPSQTDRQAMNALESRDITKDSFPSTILWQYQYCCF